MSKRLNLREFQQNLINQLQAKDLAVERVSTLGVQIAKQNWLVEMADVDEIMPVPKLANVPFAKPWFRGVANVRGNLYGVVDMIAYQESGVATGDAENRVILVSSRFEFNVALLVDRVFGLRDARNWLQSELGGQVEYHDEQGASWRKLDISAILEQAEFLQIGV
ncbi:MAG: chemotaxis protein CheW [Gallionella sp.]|jgi:twitching motility protein PilI|nr:chemotaxis protein CheW [Gallionella sp.]